MPLAEHLHPKTYWEKRTELLEESMTRLFQILAASALPQQTVYQLQDHFSQWSRILGDLEREFPPPAA